MGEEHVKTQMEVIGQVKGGGPRVRAWKDESTNQSPLLAYAGLQELSEASPALMRL